MIYRFMYQNPPKATRHASMVIRGTAKDLSIIAKAAYQAKYGTDMVADGYSFFAHSAESGDVYAGEEVTEETKFYDGDENPTLYQDANGKYQKRDEDIDRPDRYLQGEIDLIDAAYLLFPWDQFKGFMKITIMRYTLRYEHKGWLKDLDKITVYTRRLKELEVKNKEREDRKNEK